jgi:hypothetical protein
VVRGANGYPRTTPHAPRHTTRTLDLDLIVASDRDVLARALDPDPARRHPSCTALIEALETAALTGSDRLRRCLDLPPVIPAAKLIGPVPPPPAILPAIDDVLAGLTAEPYQPSAPDLRERGLSALHRKRYWTYKFPVQVIRGATRLKVQGFSEEWGAALVQEEADSYFLLHLDLTPHLGARAATGPCSLEMRLQVRPPAVHGQVSSEARVILRPIPELARDAVEILERVGPVLLDSLRSYLQAGPERRSEERWPSKEPLLVYPVMAGPILGEPLAAESKDVSRSGVSFRLSQAPPSNQLYLHWHRPQQAARFAFLAQVTRLQPLTAGGFEVGAVLALADQ